MKIYTIGFTQKSAERFFNILQDNGIERVVDIRLHPDGQLAGFSKQDDLRYFLQKLIHCDYVRLPSLAPLDEILKTYRADKNWGKYAAAFEGLLDSRDIPDSLDRRLFEEKICCLLCSEPTSEKCHRRLVAERLASAWKSSEIIHI
jgi:uncharacterized protein (DUF488 family)